MLLQNLMVDLFYVNDQSWILNILNIIHSFYEHSGKKKFYKCFI